MLLVGKGFDQGSNFRLIQLLYLGSSKSADDSGTPETSWVAKTVVSGGPKVAQSVSATKELGRLPGLQASWKRWKKISGSLQFPLQYSENDER